MKQVKLKSMVQKENLHLGQQVRYAGEAAVIDALLQNCVGLVVGGKAVMTSYENVYAGV